MLATLSYLKAIRQVVSVLPSILQQAMFVKISLPPTREGIVILQTVISQIVELIIARYSLMGS